MEQDSEEVLVNSIRTPVCPAAPPPPSTIWPDSISAVQVPGPPAGVTEVAEAVVGSDALVVGEASVGEGVVVAVEFCCEDEHAATAPTRTPGTRTQGTSRARFMRAFCRMRRSRWALLVLPRQTSFNDPSREAEKEVGG